MLEWNAVFFFKIRVKEFESVKKDIEKTTWSKLELKFQYKTTFYLIL